MHDANQSTVETFFSSKGVFYADSASAVQVVILSFAPLFSKRVFNHARLLIIGAILAPGKRTVTSALRIMGKGHAPDFQTYHRVLNRDRWSALQGSRILLLQLVQAFAPSGPVLMGGVDKTIEGRWVAKISARGIYRDRICCMNALSDLDTHWIVVHAVAI